jgi:hypothetical protein
MNIAINKDNCQPRLFNETYEDGKYSLHAAVIRTPDGINIYLGGGELPHIGTVVISQPRQSLKGNGLISCTTSVFNLISHKDDGLAIPLAEKICKEFNQVVVVSAGVHIDNATERDIKRLIENLDKLISKLETAIS